jgi:hypothetical protein
VARASDKPTVSVSAPTEPVRLDSAVEWTAHIENTTGQTLHVSHRIQSVHPQADGSVLEVSTERPALADEVHIPFISVDTVPVPPGERLDQDFRVELPLRIARFVGIPPRTEVTEWTPSPEFELRLTLAFGDRPFHLPSDKREMARALKQWAQVVPAEPVRLTAEAERGGNGDAVN